MPRYFFCTALVALCWLPGLSIAAERVVSLAPHLTELVCAVGACDQLVGITAYTDYPASVKKLPVVGDAVQVNTEALLALRPTRVLAWDGGTPPALISRLQRLGLKVETININTLNGVAVALEQLGNELGHATQGASAAANYRERIATLASRYHDAATLRVFYQIETTPAYTVNGDSPISQVIELCGGINIFAKLPTLAAPVSDEAVLAAKPDVVLHSDHDAAAMLAYWARYADVPPVKQGHIYGVDADLLARSGPRLADGAELVCATLNLARKPAR